MVKGSNISKNLLIPEFDFNNNYDAVIVAVIKMPTLNTMIINQVARATCLLFLKNT
jgi:hypothetical protein